MHPWNIEKKYTACEQQEIHAQYILSKPDEIKKALKNQTKDIFVAENQEKGSTLTIVSLDLDLPRRMKQPAEHGIRALFEKSCMAPAAFAYKMLTALNEHILAEDEKLYHYEIT
jgi:hypothetical protein